MRLLVLTALALMWAPSAWAQSVADQVERSYRTFAGNLSQADYLGGRYGESVFAGTAGKWARLNGPDGKTGVETYGADRDRICASDQALTITANGPYGASILVSAPAGTFVQDYSLVAGSTFAEHTDTDQYLKAIGLGPDKVGAKFDQQRAVALVVVNQLVQIYRPSADVIVLTRDRGYPAVLARCDK